MTREDLLRDMYEVCSYLMKKHEELEMRYGDFPEFEEDDEGSYRWAYGVLESLCGIKTINCAKEFDSISGYRETVDEFHYEAGYGIRKVMETGQVNFR